MYLYFDRENMFKEMFNPMTGFYARTGILERQENGELKDTDVDPFMRNFPQLLDVGIMGHCIHAKTGFCAKAGVQCYQGGATKEQSNMALEDYQSIINQSKGKVFQIALGGRGDPNKHENFGEILKYTREAGIIPNYTTSGFGLTDEEIVLSKTYCGAVAVSEYFTEHTQSAIERFVAAGVKTNIHYVLSAHSIDKVITRLAQRDFPAGINAVIFLLHKPVGLGTEENVLKVDDPRLTAFFSLIDQADFPFKVGFDACSIPGLVNFTKNINDQSFDTCEGGRYSAYITSDMKMLPCSFDSTQLRWSKNLHEVSMLEAWKSEEFDAFRSILSSRCGSCKDRHQCMGGCPIVPQIVLCNREEKDSMCGAV